MFQSKVRERGALPAYRLSHGNFLAIDRSGSTALEVMSKMQRASVQLERKQFIRNPRPKITEAVEIALRQAGKLEGLSPQAEEEAIEAVAAPLWRLASTQSVSQA